MSIARVLGVALTLGVVSFGAAAQAPEWTYMGVTTDGVAILAKEPKHVEGATVMWTRLLFENHLLTALEEYDCGRGRSRVLHIRDNAYAREGGVGELLGSKRGPEPWLVVVPGTAAASLLERACGNGV